MFIQPNLEDEIVRADKKLAELLLEFERLNLNVESLLGDLSLSEEAVSHFCNTKDHFEESTWHKLQEERAKIDSKLSTQLGQIKNPAQTKQRMGELKVAPHWLFVR